MDPDSTLNAGAAVADTGHWTLARARRPQVGVGPSARGLRLLLLNFIGALGERETRDERGIFGLWERN